MSGKLRLGARKLSKFAGIALLLCTSTGIVRMPKSTFCGGSNLPSQFRARYPVSLRMKRLRHLVICCRLFGSFITLLYFVDSPSSGCGPKTICYRLFHDHLATTMHPHDTRHNFSFAPKRNLGQWSRDQLDLIIRQGSLSVGLGVPGSTR